MAIAFTVQQDDLYRDHTVRRESIVNKICSQIAGYTGREKDFKSVALP